MIEELELSELELRRRRNVKWNEYGNDVLPAWIAEMDYRVAAPVQAIIERTAGQQDYGYAKRGGGQLAVALADGFAARMKDLHGWELAAETVQFISTFEQGILAALLAFTEEGDGIIVQTPCYPPYYDVLKVARRRFVPNPLLRVNGQYEVDFDHLERVASEGAKAIILCNPQNPTGRVFDRAELQALADIVIRYGLILICDEIHSDIVYVPQRHVPIASLGSEIAARTVTLNSASKSFNLPGLDCGVMCFGDSQMAARYHAKMPRMLLGEPNTFGFDATIAAWSEGASWSKTLMSNLTARRDQFVRDIRRQLPAIGVCEPQGTYLAWLDLTAFNLRGSASQHLLHRGKVATMPGEKFDPTAEAFVRVNFATSEHIVAAIVDRIAEALS